MKFSIVIPAHNARDRIGRALQSIEQQIFTDYEIVVVCDNCTDGTIDVVKTHNNIKLSQVEFGNAGAARNEGLRRCDGDYVLFMDDDDWWLHEFVLDQLSKKLTDEDILCFGFIWKDVGYAGPLDNGGGTHFVAVWNKCWRNKFLIDHHIQFSTASYGEDADFHHAAMRAGPKIVNWEMPLYYYNYLRPGSLSDKYYKGEL